MNEKEFDTDCTDEVICPYCHYNNGGDSCSDGPPSGQQQCYECLMNFDCGPSFSVSYYTKKVPCWNGETHSWEISTEYSFDRGNKKVNPKYCRHCGERGYEEVSLTTFKIG